MIETSTTEIEMKNISTPRTLSECSFTVGHAGIQKNTDYSLSWYVAMCVCAVAAVAVIVMTGGVQ